VLCFLLCMSSSCVSCTKCYQFIWIVHTSISSISMLLPFHLVIWGIKLSLCLSESLLGNLSDKISSLARDSLSEGKSLVVQELLIVSNTCLRSTPVFIWLRVVQSLVLYIVFSRSLFVLLAFFLCPLYCFSFFDWRLLSPLGIIKPFVSGFVWESQFLRDLYLN
jgi:hypothetical protein